MHQLKSKLTHILNLWLLNDYNITLGLCIAENTAVTTIVIITIIYSHSLATYLLILKNVRLLKKHRDLSKKGNNSVQCSIPVVHSTVCTYPKVVTIATILKANNYFRFLYILILTDTTSAGTKGNISNGSSLAACSYSRLRIYV